MEPKDVYELTKHKFSECLETFDKAANECFACSPVIQKAAVSSAFIDMFCQWEWFQENIFIAYMLGGTTLSGTTLLDQPIARDENHALGLLQSAANNPPDWSNPETLLKLAQLYFQGGKVEIITASVFYTKTYLTEMKKIRNAIAHRSNKSSEQFASLVRSKSMILVGVDVPSFLIAENRQTKKSFFRYYEGYLEYAVDSIAEINIQ